ncbi:MAG: hypothetical protein AAFU55_17040 [Pseudomonadota bacterium]
MGYHEPKTARRSTFEAIAHSPHRDDEFQINAICEEIRRIWRDLAHITALNVDDGAIQVTSP